MNQRTKERNNEIGVLLKDFITRFVSFYNHLEEEPVSHPVPESAVSYMKELRVPKNGRPVAEVYEEMRNEVYGNMPFAQHPRSFSCVPSTASLLSWMGDVMTNAYNPHASCQINVPVGGAVEKQLIRYLCDRAGYPEGAGGLFVSGGSIANLTALTAARDAKLSYEERGRAVIYVSDQTHASVSKGLHIIGFHEKQIRMVPTDDHFCMNAAVLREMIEGDLAEQKRPFVVVASAGTTNTGSIDPLAEIAALCRLHDMWLHVDGAYGASALLSETQREKLSGIELSDSLSWDAHKWLMQTYACSMVLVRDQSALVKSFAAHPEYLKDAEASEGSIEFWDLGPELTRPARGLKLWLTLQVLGSDEISREIAHGCALAEFAQDCISRLRGWEIVSPAQLGIVNFRYVGDGTLSEQHLNEINQTISKEITESGFAQVFTTELCGRKVLRMCTIHPETTEQDIAETIARLNRAKAINKGMTETVTEAVIKNLAAIA